MSEPYYELVTPCEHGKTMPHALPAHQAVGGISNSCSGGSRVRVNIDYEAAKYAHRDLHLRVPSALNTNEAKVIVDAALGTRPRQPDSKLITYLEGE